MKIIDYYTDLNDEWKEIFSKAEYFTAENFKYHYDQALRVFRYAHNGAMMGDVDPSPKGKESWINAINKLRELVGDSNIPRVKVQIYSQEEVREPLSGGGTSGFVFSLDDNIILWTILSIWIS